MSLRWVSRLLLHGIGSAVARVSGSMICARALVFAGVVQGVFAQSPADDEATPVDIPGLPPYVAEGERTPLNEAASSVTVIGDRGPTADMPADFGDLSGRVPNLTVMESSLRSFGDIFSFRGVGNTAFFSNPGVVVYLDGAPMGPAFSLGEVIGGVERIEIHRGPQGAAFGRNGPGGVIEMHSRKPEGEWFGRFATAHGGFGRTHLEMSLAGPVVEEEIFIAVAGAFTKEDGYFENPAFPDGVDFRESWSGRISLRWAPTPEWEIGFSAAWERFRDGAQRISSLAADPFSATADFAGQTRIDRNAQSARIQTKFGAGTLTLVSARYDWRMEPNAIDLDLSPVPGFTSTIDQSVEQWSHEIVIESIDAGAGHSHWKVGLFYLDAETNGDALRTFIVGTPFGPLPVSQRTVFLLGEENVAAFGTYQHPLTEQMGLTFGMRIENSRKAIDRVRSDDFGPPRPVVGDSEYLEVAPSIGVLYTFENGVSFHARLAKGYKPGGYSAFTDDPMIAEFVTESFLSTEVSLMFASKDDGFSCRITGFWNEVSDLQVERSFTLTDYIIVNAPRAHALGLEIEADHRITSELSWHAAFGFTHMRFDEYSDPFTGVDYAGNRPPYTPAYTLAAGVEYHGGNGLFAAFEVNAAGRAWFDEANSSFFEEPAYALFNGRIGIKAGPATVLGYARNLTDTRYYTNKVVDLGAGVPGEPRSFGVKVEVEF